MTFETDSEAEREDANIAEEAIQRRKEQGGPPGLCNCPTCIAGWKELAAIFREHKEGRRDG